MHKAPDAQKLTVVMLPDARRQLEIWASENCTSLSAELIRSVRERSARERAAREGTAR